MSNLIKIIGAGPACLVASINLAKAGVEVEVFEQKSDVGLRFNGDYQGIENWSTKEDAVHVLNSFNISANFICTPFFEGEFFDPSLNSHKIGSANPIFYLVERGSGENSLDQGLKRQALDAGVRFQWNKKVEKFDNEPTIVGTGPKAADVIAKGIVFNTSNPDACYGYLDNKIAPAGYAYLLVCNGRATLATVLYEEFNDINKCFELTLETVNKTVDIDINNPLEFGGYGNFFLDSPLVKRNIIYVGESAGFQDALWGFGLRYAMLSGYLAAQSILTGKSYEDLCKTRILPKMKTSLANRWIFAHMGNTGYKWALSKASRSDRVLETLANHHRLTLFKKIAFHIAKQWYRTRLKNKECMHENCDCIWCRHGKDHKR